MADPEEQQREGSGYHEHEGIYRSLYPPFSLPSYPHQGFPAFLFAGPIGDPANASKKLLIDATTGFSISCSQFREKVDSVASGLASILGVSQGDVVLLLLGNTVFFPLAFHAILSIGAVATTANPVNTDSEIQKQLRDSKAKFVITVPGLIPKLGDLKQQRLSIVLLDDDEEQRVSSAAPTRFDFVPFRSLLDFKSSKPVSNLARIRLGDPAVVLYSSGTTGPSKGVVLSHGNLISSILCFLEIPKNDDQEEQDVISMVVAPLFHVAGLVVTGCTMIRQAATLVVLPKFDFIRMLDAIQRYRVTYLPMVPPLVVALTKHPAVANFDLTSVIKAGSGAAPLAKETLEAFLTRFPHIRSFGQGYGMTETTAQGAYGPGPAGSTGKLVSNHEAKVIDIETGKPQPPNARGELWIRGPCIMQGYLNNLAATIETIDSEGWLHTGDVVYFDEQGYLFVVDRLKELIKYKGYQVAPAELEALLLTHPDVADAAVVPYPDEDTGEIPLAYVVRKDGRSLSEQDVMDFVARQVAPHKKVRRVAFLDAVPKSPSGKILRKDLVRLARSPSKL